MSSSVPSEVQGSPAVFSAEDIFLVSGASSGIGAAIALRLNALGAAVIANGRDAGRLESRRELAARPEHFHPEALDLAAAPEALPDWVSSLRGRYGKFRGMVCAAGQTLTAPFMRYDLASARAIFDICLHAPLLLARGLLDRRNCLPGASLLFIAAAAAVSPNKGQTVYGAAKAALVCAARCLSREFAPRGVRVNCISPGLVRTPMLEETLALLGEDFLETEEPLYPLGLGQPEDVAGLAAFLLSPAGRWATGQNWILDGGRLG